MGVAKGRQSDRWNSKYQNYDRLESPGALAVALADICALRNTRADRAAKGDYSKRERTAPFSPP